MDRHYKLAAIAIVLCRMAGCFDEWKKGYGEEGRLYLPGSKRLVWAIAPTLNISGVKEVDPLLQSDLVYQELQEVDGLTVVPVNRVAQVYASLKIEKVESERQAYAVCEMLGCDGLLIPTVTAYDPYDPPKLGVSLQLFRKNRQAAPNPPLDVHELDRAATPSAYKMPATQQLVQAVGMYDASQGTVRDRVHVYASGRSDPNGPLRENEIFLSMDRYSGFVYHELIGQLLQQMTKDQ